MKDYIIGRILRVRTYMVSVSKWLVLAMFTGVCCGLIGTLFRKSVDYATTLRGQNPWLLFLLPVAGLIIVAVYTASDTIGVNTNDVIEAVQTGKPLHLLLIPAIFIGTVLTHLCGGSSGREGAALQMGGDIGYHVAKWLHFSEHDRRTAVMSGMAAFFAALFGTPLAATLFAMMVINVGMAFYSAFIPCFAASLTAYGISLAFGVAPVRFAVTVPGLDPIMALRVAGLAVGCSFVCVFFCGFLHLSAYKMGQWFPNRWLKIVLGAAFVIAFTLLLGNTRYNGTGVDIIEAAIVDGKAEPLDWLLKILLTAVTLNAGFKGGEVVPSFFVGATFGCVVGPLLGIPAQFGAALGLVTVFCGVSNCLISALFLAVEIFGSGGITYFAIACGLCYVLSGYSGLYTSQAILTSKLDSEYLDSDTHHPVRYERGVLQNKVRLRKM